MKRLNMFDVREKGFRELLLHVSAGESRLERDNRIRRMYASDVWTLDGIGELFNLSKQRVQQIVKSSK